MSSRLFAVATFLALVVAVPAAQSAGKADSASGISQPGMKHVQAQGEIFAVTSFGDNPGALGMFAYVPVGLPAGAPLVVVMHGCVQGVTDAVHAGWNDMADEYGFAVLYPEQSTANNPVRCFNWAGEHGDLANLTRGQGENKSIISMVDTMIADYGLDAERVFVTGFSAGAAFTAVMLATHPDRFAAGAIQAGIPFHCANTVATAYDCQQINQNPLRKRTAEEWGSLVRDAYPGFAGSYPRVSIWHGMNDTFIVHHENMIELTKQWTNVHGIAMEPSSTDTIAGHALSRYVAGGQVVVETYGIAGMGHAIAYGAGDDEHPCAPGGFAQYYEDKNICSTYHIAKFFGVTGDAPLCEGDACCQGEQCTDLDNGPPTISITSPADGSVVSGTIEVSASASDDLGVDRVEFYVNGALQATDRSEPYSFSWPTLAFGDGDHRLMAIAYDKAGKLAVDDSVQVLVDATGRGHGARQDGLVGCSSSGGDPAGWPWILLGCLGFWAWRPRSDAR